MKKKNVLLWLCTLCFPLGSMAQGFIHPGALHTQADFDRVKEKLANGEEPWTAAYKFFKTSPYIMTVDDRHPTPVRRIVRGCGAGCPWLPPGENTDNYGTPQDNAHAAYQFALEWKITGDEKYARKAVEYLNAWARTCKDIGGNNNYALASGLSGYAFANAGELMRDYEGWKPADFKRYQDFIRRVFVRNSLSFLENRAEGHDDHYWSNWGLCNVLCIISAGILCDDVWVYNRGMEFYKYMEDHRYGESIHMLVYHLFEDEDGPFGYIGQMHESNRDQSHASMAVALAADVCGVGRNQGEDTYMHKDDRIAAGFEYVARYNMWQDVPYVPYTNMEGGYFPEPGWGGRGVDRPCWPRIINYYENVRGVEMPWGHAIMMRHNNGTGLDGGGGFYGGGGGYDHLGFTALMCSLDPLTDKTKVPTKLGGTVQYNGVSTTRTEVSNIPKGSQMKITVILPEDEEDTGKWSWDDDPTCKSNERELTLETSSVIRVRYINSKGVECTRMYSLHVEGEGTPEGYADVYAKVNSVEIHDSVIYAKKYANVILGMNYDGFTIREWKWERSTDGKRWTDLRTNCNLLEIESVAKTYYYRVTMTHPSGATIIKNFLVEVAEVDPYVIHGNQSQPGTNLVLEKGSSFSMYGVPTSILGKLPETTRIYKWVVGTDTIQADTLTYHLDEQGNKVADLNDTLHIKSLDSCFKCKLVFQRVAESGAEAKSVCHFNVDAYEACTEDPSSEDSYYISNEWGAYLRNTDAQFVPYAEENDQDYLWRLRRLSASYGNRYMLFSRTNSKMHLSKDGKMMNGSDYANNSFNILRKCTDEGVYAIQRSPAASGGMLFPSEDGMLLEVSQAPCSGFPFRIVKKTDNPDGMEEVMAEMKGEEAQLISCNRHGNRLAVEAQESGMLKIYSFDGRLVKSVRCTAGKNEVGLPVQNVGWLLHYVGTSGRTQGMKMR